MINLVIDPKISYYGEAEKEDGRRIVEVFKQRGYNICLIDACDAWQNHSSDMCAQWLFLPDDDEVLFETLFDMFKES